MKGAEQGSGITLDAIMAVIQRTELRMERVEDRMERVEDHNKRAEARMERLETGLDEVRREFRTGIMDMNDRITSNLKWYIGIMVIIAGSAGAFKALLEFFA